MSLPLPNEPALGGTVVASVNYRDGDDELPHDRYTLVVLRPTTPYYLVTTVRDERPQGGELVPEWAVAHDNIVHAINGGIETVLGVSVEELHNGYVDQGGDV